MFALFGTDDSEIGIRFLSDQGWSILQRGLTGSGSQGLSLLYCVGLMC